MKELFLNDTARGSGSAVTDFKEGDAVVYIRRDKLRRPYLDDCEPGIVSSVSETYIHVKFWNQKLQKYDETSKPCYPGQLWKRKEVPVPAAKEKAVPKERIR